MRSIPDAAVASVARIGALLAIALTVWTFCTALHLPLLVFAIAAIVAIAACLFATRRAEPPPSTSLPALPLIGVTLVLLSPCALLLHATTGEWPHWFGSADEAYTLLVARALAVGFPPPDLSWAGSAIHYHFGTPLLVAMLSRITTLPIHAIYYGVLPIAMRIILVAAVLECARVVASDLSPRLRVLVPIAVSGTMMIDAYWLLWRLHNIAAHGIATMSEGPPILSLQPGIFSRPVFDSGWLAVAFLIVLAGTWTRTTILEKASLLFAIFLVKQQVFLPVGAGFGIVALLALRRRDWKPCAAGALALAAAVPMLSSQSTYGTLAKLHVGCGALCQQLLDQHHLATRVPHALLLVIELLIFIGGFHLFIVAAARSREQLLMIVAMAGIAVPLALSLVPSTLLRQRFDTVYAPIADRLFMPLSVYLDRIFDVAVVSAADAFTLVLPILAIPLGAAWMITTPRRTLRVVLACWLAATLGISTWTSSIAGERTFDRAKEVAPDAMAALRAIPNDGHATITNDLAYDDRVERHLPLLNIWAAAVSGKQFYASAFMFTFQLPDAAERLRRTAWFFNDATPAERVAFARSANIGYVLVRTDLTNWDGAGFALIARRGRYEVGRLQQ